MTRSLDTSYALVHVPDARGVRVHMNHHFVGRTNRWGDLLVPDLLPYFANAFDIDDQDIPVDYDLESTSFTVAPPYRGGAVLRFDGRPVRGFQGRITIRTPDGDVTPAYGTLSVDAGGRRVESPLGSNGDFYLEHLPTGSVRATVVSEVGGCALTIDVPATRSTITQLGDLVCVSRPQ